MAAGQQPSDTFHDWYRNAAGLGHIIAAEITEGVDPYAAAHDAGLPTPPEIRYESVNAFLVQPDDDIAALGTRGVRDFYVALRPLVPEVYKKRILGIEATDIVPYVIGNAVPGDYAKYVVQVAEFAPAAYGATSIVDNDGSIIWEMVDGEMNRLATGKDTPKYTATYDALRRRTTYSFDDERLRRTVHTALRYMGGEHALPGYYECSIIQRRNGLAPVFFDYKNNRVFHQPRRPAEVLADAEQAFGTITHWPEAEAAPESPDGAVEAAETTEAG